MKNPIVHFMGAAVFAGVTGLANAAAEEMTSADLENQVLTIVGDTHVVANYARQGHMTRHICEVTAGYTKGPDMAKGLYSAFMQNQYKAGEIGLYAKTQRLEAFNMLADFWQSNINVILDRCAVLTPE